jgi:NifU-like protein involved in Fe-S cluster formation
MSAGMRQTWLAATFTKDGRRVICFSGNGCVLSLDSASAACQWAMQSRPQTCRPILSCHHDTLTESCAFSTHDGQVTTLIELDDDSGMQQQFA